MTPPPPRFPHDVRAYVFTERRAGMTYARIIEEVRRRWPDSYGDFTVSDAQACKAEADRLHVGRKPRSVGGAAGRPMLARHA